MHIRLTEERRDRMTRSLIRFFSERLDHELSPFQADQIIDFFVKELGAPVYNQAISDAHSYIQDKLVDLEGEFYEPEERD